MRTITIVVFAIFALGNSVRKSVNAEDAITRVENVEILEKVESITKMNPEGRLTAGDHVIISGMKGKTAVVTDFKDGQYAVATPKVESLLLMKADNLQLDENLVTCSATGQNRKVQGMSIKWAVPKNRCVELCGPTLSKAMPRSLWASKKKRRHQETGGSTAEQAFARAFDVSFDDPKSKCVCSVNSDAGARVLVQFNPIDDAEAQQCADGISDEIHEVCWELYKKARGTRPAQSVSSKLESSKLMVFRYSVPFAAKDFTVTRKCGDQCNNNQCQEVSLPGILDSMSKDDKKKTAEGIQKINAGEKPGKDLEELIKVLPEEDKKKLIEEELIEVLPEEDIAKLIKDATRPTTKKFKVVDNGMAKKPPVKKPASRKPKLETIPEETEPDEVPETPVDTPVETAHLNDMTFEKPVKEDPFAVGNCVIAKNLKGQSHWNGQVGVILKKVTKGKAKGRLQVLFGKDSKLVTKEPVKAMLKAENLRAWRPLPPTPGQKKKTNQLPEVCTKKTNKKKKAAKA